MKTKSPYIIAQRNEKGREKARATRLANLKFAPVERDTDIEDIRSEIRNFHKIEQSLQDE